MVSLAPKFGESAFRNNPIYVVSIKKMFPLKRFRKKFFFGENLNIFTIISKSKEKKVSNLNKSIYFLLLFSNLNWTPLKITLENKKYL